MPDFLPAREAELVTWSTTFNGLIVATPTAYGLTAAQATAYTALHNAFVTAYNAANGDSTRTPAGIITKDQAKNSLKSNARELAGIIQKCPTVTDTQRSALGLTVRSGPSPIPAPAMSPQIDVISVTGNTVRLRLHDPDNTTRRGKPAGVAGITLFSFIGDTPPTTSVGWNFEGNTTRTVVDVPFPSAAPGTKVWFTAFYRNERDESGPACAPIGTNIAGGGVMAA